MKTYPPTSPIKRPKILVTAAKIGSTKYLREKDLRKLLQSPWTPLPGKALKRLQAMELQLEEDRKEKIPTYSAKRHIAVLSALIFEMSLVAALPAPANCNRHPKASGSDALRSVI